MLNITSSDHNQLRLQSFRIKTCHDGVIKWKHFPRYWPFVRRTHRSPVNSLHKGQWRGVLMFSLICAWINGWVKKIERLVIWDAIVLIMTSLWCSHWILRVVTMDVILKRTIWLVFHNITKRFAMLNQFPIWLFSANRGVCFTVRYWG